MPSNTAASMYGGAGGRGSKVSVASLEGLRNVLRNETERDSAPAAAAKPAAPPPSAAPAAPAAPADDKQTLRGLNDRLSGYLGRVKQLERENGDLERQIDEILAKRKAPEGRDWDEVEKPLEDLKKQVFHQLFFSIRSLEENTIVDLVASVCFYRLQFSHNNKCNYQNNPCNISHSFLSVDQRHHHGQCQAAAAD